MLLKCLEFRETLLVSARLKALSELVAEESIKILHTTHVSSSLQFAEFAKGQVRQLEVVTDIRRATGPSRK